MRQAKGKLARTNGSKTGVGRNVEGRWKPVGRGKGNEWEMVEKSWACMLGDERRPGGKNVFVEQGKSEQQRQSPHHGLTCTQHKAFCILWQSIGAYVGEHTV